MTLQFTSDESVTAGGFSVHFDASMDSSNIGTVANVSSD